MQQPHENEKFTPIPINKGNRPDWQTRLGYPQLLNFFVGESGYLYSTPGLGFFTDAPCRNTRAIHFSPYGEGSYIAVTDSLILHIFLNGTFRIIAKIKNTKMSVQIDENLQNQVGIVDGRTFYVYNVKTKVLEIIGETHGFEFKTPISIVVLNSIAVILDYETSGWAISGPNNMALWPSLDNVPQIGSQLTTAVSLQTLGNNLYIFGSTGIERWVPNSGNNPYLFPFTLDVNYRKDFGAIGTNSVMRGFSEVFFLSSKFTPMSLTEDGGLRELGERDAVPGIAKILSQYEDLDDCRGSFYSYSGNYFYSMTFLTHGVNWTYCQNSNTWAFNDDMIVSSLRTGEIVANNVGIFTLELIPQMSKKRQWRSERIIKYKGLEPYRIGLCGFEPRIVQGLLQPANRQFMELTISKDSASWSNTVRKYIGLTGERNARVTWAMNMTGIEFTFLLTYNGILDFTIESCAAIFK